MTHWVLLYLDKVNYAWVEEGKSKRAKQYNKSKHGIEPCFVVGGVLRFVGGWSTGLAPFNKKMTKDSKRKQDWNSFVVGMAKWLWSYRRAHLPPKGQW